MLRLLGVLLALVTSQGWQWARMAEDHRLLEAQWGFCIALAMSGLFLLHQIILALKLPAPLATVRERGSAVNLLLQALLSEYYTHLKKDLPEGSAGPLVRCNVMMPVRWKFGWKRYLKICYKACPERVVYKPDELTLRWKKKNGVVGWVWCNGEDHTYSATDTAAANVDNSLSKEQKAVVSHLKSVYSVPILKSGVVIGVLTMDAQDDLDRTCFDRDGVKAIVDRYAKLLPSQCFAQGIAAS